MIDLELAETGEYAFSHLEREFVEEICLSAEPDIRAWLPDLQDKVTLIIETGSVVIPQTGEVGAAVAPGRVKWSFDPKRTEGFKVIAGNHLRPALFHEFHHLVRGWVMTGGKPMDTFMDAVVSEGLATAFERDAGGRTPLWGEYPEDVTQWVRELLELPVTAPYSEWMFQHPDGRSWVGYRAGTFIADLAIKNSGLSAAELVQVPAPEVLELAGIAVNKV